MLEDRTITLYYHKQFAVCSDTNMHMTLHMQEGRTLVIHCSKAAV